MRRYARMTIDEAMAILEEAVARSRTKTVQTADVWEALDTLVAHCPERWPLKQFWTAAGSETEHVSARYQNTNASLNGIARQLGRRR